nr:hypothetical protein [Tanacetum cinerariifolium]
MGDEHLDTIPATESDDVIKSSVKNLVPILSESKGIPDTMCDVHLDNNHTPLEAKDHFKNVINSNDDISSSDDDSLYNENIEYVEASPHDSKLVSLEVAAIVISDVEEIEDDNLREKLTNVHLLIANIEALKDNPTPSFEFLAKDGKPLICYECEGPLRGGFCWFCDLRAETSFAFDPNPNSFDDSQNLSDYPPQPQYEIYLCELCGNDSHYGYDCPPRFSLVYEHEPSYNQNYDDNYYPHNSPSFLCCDNCGGPHESFQCQPMNQNYYEPNPWYGYGKIHKEKTKTGQNEHENEKSIKKPELKTFLCLKVKPKSPLIF